MLEGSGRTSVAAIAVQSGDYHQHDLGYMDRQLTKKGFSPKETQNISISIGVRLQDYNVHQRISLAGSKFPVGADLTFLETIYGLRFSGSINAVIESFTEQAKA